MHVCTIVGVHVGFVCMCPSMHACSTLIRVHTIRTQVRTHLHALRYEQNRLGHAPFLRPRFPLWACISALMVHTFYARQHTHVHTCWHACIHTDRINWGVRRFSELALMLSLFVMIMLFFMDDTWYQLNLFTQVCVYAFLSFMYKCMCVCVCVCVCMYVMYACLFM